jgi:hypothetical protein
MSPGKVFDHPGLSSFFSIKASKWPPVIRMTMKMI